MRGGEGKEGVRWPSERIENETGGGRRRRGVGDEWRGREDIDLSEKLYAVILRRKEGRRRRARCTFYAKSSR